MKHRPLRTTLLLTVVALFVAGCETVEGAGRDLQTAGATVSSEAQKAQQ